MASPLDTLRQEAIDHLRGQRWEDLLSLQPELAQDVDYWVTMWGPSCAVAAYHLGHDDARPRLEALLEQGFHDLALHVDLFADTFATLPDWETLRARIVANTPPPPLEVLDWPTAVPHLPLSLDRLPVEDEERLATRLPTPSAGAQETALALLSWVTSRWRHTGAHHVDSRSAHEVLDRVEQGERFACREYTLLLTQALNAVGIPARPLAVYRADYHASLGTGHAVTEAWIDDLGGWIVLDGQNGATWRDADGTPFGVAALQAMYAAGRVADFVGDGPNHDPSAAEEWMSYFGFCSTGGTSWRSGSFVPLSEGGTVVESRPLVRSATPPSPDLTEVSTDVVDLGGPAVRFGSTHPYALGFDLTRDGVTTRLELDEAVALAGAEGEHHWRVATRTAYGPLRPAALRFVVRTAGRGA